MPSEKSRPQTFLCPSVDVNWLELVSPARFLPRVEFAEPSLPEPWCNHRVALVTEISPLATLCPRLIHHPSFQPLQPRPQRRLFSPPSQHTCSSDRLECVPFCLRVSVSTGASQYMRMLQFIRLREKDRVATLSTRSGTKTKIKKEQDYHPITDHCSVHTVPHQS